MCKILLLLIIKINVKLTVVNRALATLYGGSLELTLTVFLPVASWPSFVADP